MRTSYAVTWQEGTGQIHPGKLELGPGGFVLEGSDGSGALTRDVGYEQVANVRVARIPGDRLCGRPTLVVDRLRNGSLRIAGVSQPGIISELAEHLTAMRLGERPRLHRLVIILPLQQGARERAKALLEKGPPFDPEAAGLERHHVFLADNDAVFVFEADASDAVERLASDETLWSAVAGWTDLVAGPPLLAEEVYAWVRPVEDDDVFFGSTPGPGDSEGGDVHAPSVG
jgi:hypothetical protein